MDDVDFESVLKDLRAELDALDQQLVLLLKERSDVIDRVIERKSASGLGPVDMKREHAILAPIEEQAASVGLDPKLARQILSAVIDAFTAREARVVG